MWEGRNMKAFLSNVVNSKIGCALFMTLSLVLFVLLMMEKSLTPGIYNESPGIPNELERVKADYIEMKRTAYGRSGEVELGENELVISRTG
jgi:hypothetical protein